MGAVAEGLKDVAKDAAKQIVNAPSSAVKTAVTQTTATAKTPEEEAKIQEQKAYEFRRHQEITAEIEQIRRQNEQRTGPTLSTETETNQTLNSPADSPRIDEASRQAVGKAEQGRNFKG